VCRNEEVFVPVFHVARAAVAHEERFAAVLLQREIIEVVLRRLCEASPLVVS
jgi:type IV secretory pathway VirB3-like protein